MDDICYVDTETTSLREPHLPGGRRAWEVALIRVFADGRPAKASWLQVTDVDLADADPAALVKGRWRERWTGPTQHAPPPVFGELEGETETYREFDEDAGEDRQGLMVDATRTKRVTLERVPEAHAARVIEELTRDGAIIAGSNPAFDLAIFAELLRRYRLPATWFYKPRDVTTAAHGRLRAAVELGQPDTSPEHDGWAAPSYPTSVLSEACGVPEPADRHAAWADVTWMRRLDAVVRGVSLSPRPKDGEPAILPA